MPSPKVKIIQAKTLENKTYLIQQFVDGNTHSSFEIYELVKNTKKVAEEFGIPRINDNGIEENTRTMCERMVEKIKEDNLYI